MQLREELRRAASIIKQKSAICRDNPKSYESSDINLSSQIAFRAAVGATDARNKLSLRWLGRSGLRNTLWTALPQSVFVSVWH